MNREVITESFEDTQLIGENIANQLRGGEVIALYGDLGSGKTTFVQGLARGLGIAKHMQSPTFIIMRTYAVSQKGGVTQFYHVDLYRTESARDIEGLGLLEMLGRPDTIVAIEWPEKLGKHLPQKRIDIHCTYIEDERRNITINEHR